MTVPVLVFPSFPGASENVLFALPEPNRRYYFALKAFDEELNYSELSNCVSAGLSPESSLADQLEEGACGPNLRDFDRTRTTIENTPILR